MESEGDWDVISDKPGVGAMTNASKRVRENDVPATYAGRGSEPPAPMPSAATTVPTMPNLPPGVKSISAWGGFLISFGKFMNKRSYQSLHNSRSDEDVSYKKWLMSHYSKGSHQLRNLVEYLLAVNDEVIVESGKSQQ